MTRYGGGDPTRWDFGLDSLDVLTYIIFDQFPTEEAIDHPPNSGLPAEIVQGEPPGAPIPRQTFMYP